MQLPEPPPPPLAPLWDRVLRARVIPPDLDVQHLYVAIRDRLVHPEWEVRLHALRVLADLLPLSENALTFPFGQVVDNLGYSSPNVRKAALDALKVFCSYCEDPVCAVRAILDKCAYHDIGPRSGNMDTKVNVTTGLILSIPSVMTILRRRCSKLDLYPVFVVLGDKLQESYHKDVALRSLIKLRRACGPNDYISYISRLDPNVQEMFRHLCERYDDDACNVYHVIRKPTYNDSDNVESEIKIFNINTLSTPVSIVTDSSDDSEKNVRFSRNNFGKVIIETEIKFNCDTAITMTVLEENETEQESDKNVNSDDDYDDSSDQNTLKYNDDDYEDTDVVVKKVRFGGESIKIRTPDSENLISSEDDNRTVKIVKEDNLEEVTATVTPTILNKTNEIKLEASEIDKRVSKPKRSGIPLPVVTTKPIVSTNGITSNTVQTKQKSKSLNELYDYFKSQHEHKALPGREYYTEFQSKHDQKSRTKCESGFALTLEAVRSPEKIPSPVEPHREVEVLHNLQRSPSVSPRRHRSDIVTPDVEVDILYLNRNTSPVKDFDVTPRAATPLRQHYEWEDYGIVPNHIVNQLHNKENWISAVKAADQLHGALLEPARVRRVEPAAASLVRHMWAISDTVPATQAPAEGAVCALFRSASSGCARALLPLLLSRLAREPPPSALPHALLQRLDLHQLVDLMFDSAMIGSPNPELLEPAQLQVALCLARAAGPAAVMAAVRRRLTGEHSAERFCRQLRETLNRPVNNGILHYRARHPSRNSQLPLPVRRRARSTPAPAPPPAPPPRRLRPLPDSAPLPAAYTAGQSQHLPPRRDHLLKPLSTCGLIKKDSSATTATLKSETEKEIDVEQGDEKSLHSIGETTEISIADIIEERPKTPHSPPLKVQNITDIVNLPSQVEWKNEVDQSIVTKYEDRIFGKTESPVSQKSYKSDFSSKSPNRSLPQSRRSSPSPVRSVKSTFSTPKQSRSSTPAPVSEPYEYTTVCERDVRAALSECTVPAGHEDWEVIVSSLQEMQRLAADAGARAPAAGWRAAARAAAGHVRSLRSRVARAACSAVGSLYEHRGRALDPELDDATSALLDRCADANRFLRADAAAALSRVACGGAVARAGAALARRGATHRAGPVRAAAAQALTQLVLHHGPQKVLEQGAEARAALLRAAAALLTDAHSEARERARLLCRALASDARFKPFLKEAVTAARFKELEKHIDKLRC